MSAHIVSVVGLRREYFGKDEEDRSTLRATPADWHQATSQGFTFRGHRLSSLYRHTTKAEGGLKNRSQASSFPKYSAPTRETRA